GEARDLARISQRRGQRLIDEQRLVRRDHRPRLFEMRTPVDALQQHRVDFGEQRGNAINDFDAVLGTNLLGVLIDAPAALLDVFAPALERSDDARAGDVVFGRGIAIEKLGECRHVGCVGADDADTNVGGAGAQCGGQENDEFHDWHCTPIAQDARMYQNLGMVRRYRAPFVCFGSTVLLLVCSAAAEDSRGHILGRVLDKSSALVAGAEVTATQVAMNTRVAARSNNDGNYDLPFLLPGIYRIDVEAPGFKHYARHPIEVRVG